MTGRNRRIQPKSNEYFEVWADYYQKLKMEIPEGQLGCNPNGISTSNKLKNIETIRYDIFVHFHNFILNLNAFIV